MADVAAIALAKAALEAAEAEVVAAKRRYAQALEADDLVVRVAFLLYQRDVLAEDDWPEETPVTWEDWLSLQTDPDRDGWRRLAAEIIAEVEAARNADA